MDYQPTIGLEIHTELKTDSKMFCFCANNPFVREANINICPICTGQPGTLPVINEKAIKETIKTGLALNCRIPEHSKFDRKNYFYPDLPKGYQISQYDAPLCMGGYLEVSSIEENTKLDKSKIKNQKSKIQIKNKKIRIRRVHLEEDTGRLIHEKDYSLVDFNRAGIPLMELVTEPDLRSAKRAREFAEELQLILRYLGVSDADMEKGQMRVEVNISLIHTNLGTNNTNNIREISGQIRADSRTLGTKVEIKNLNSFRAVEKAIEYEIKRQEEILKLGKKIIQETRGWDNVRDVTISQRGKEEAHDYRYFPEPDLPPLRFDKKYIQEIQATLPELPQQKRERLKREYGLVEKDLEIFVQNKDLGEYFEKVISELEPKLKREELSKLIKLTSNYLITDLQGLLKGDLVSSGKFLITPENFAEFISLLYFNNITSNIAKNILKEMFNTGKDPSDIIEGSGLTEVKDESELEKIITEVIAENPSAVEDWKKGKSNAFQFLIGKTMAKTQGRANPEKTTKILTNFLKKS